LLTLLTYNVGLQRQDTMTTTRNNAWGRGSATST